MSYNKRIFGILFIALLSFGLMGCSGSDSITDPGDREVIDTTPPAVPTGLTLREFLGNVRVCWSENTSDSDLAGYRVYRGVAGSETLRAEQAVGACEWVDVAPPLTGCNYAVSSVDAAGNESALYTVAYRPGNSDLNVSGLTLDDD